MTYPKRNLQDQIKSLEKLAFFVGTKLDKSGAYK